MKRDAALFLPCGNSFSMMPGALRTEFLFLAVYPAHCFPSCESDKAVILIVRAGRKVMDKSIFPELMEDVFVCNDFGLFSRQFCL